MNALFTVLCVPFLHFQVVRVVYHGTNYYIFIFDTLQPKTVSAFFEILKTFQVITIPPLSIMKVLFPGFGCKLQTKVGKQVVRSLFYLKLPNKN